MKIVAFTKRGAIVENRYRIGAIISTDEIADLTHLVGDSDLWDTELLRCFDLDGKFCEQATKEIVSPSVTEERSDVILRAPVPRPGKIICIGLNYRDHAVESGMAIPESPVIFSKFPTCAIGAGEPIMIPNGSTQSDYEAELAVVIGRRAKNVRRSEALQCVFGYMNFNDVSARDFQFADGQWQRGKSCDTFAPMGPYILTADEVPDPQDLTISLRLNRQTLQYSSTGQMIFGVADLIEFLSRHTTLVPGDVIATGTPPGVGFARKPPVFLKDGDAVEVEIQGLGTLSNPVAAG